MIDYFLYKQKNAKTSFKIKLIASIFTFGSLGYMYGKYQWYSRKQWCNYDKIIQYQSQDQINSLIQQTKKPAVIYYFLSTYPEHYLFRSYMFKYSNKYSQNAIWVMCNLTQHLQHAKQALKTVIFPLPNIRLQIRFPKGQIAIFQQDQKQNLRLMKQTIGNRRQVYNYTQSMQLFEAFLQQNKIIPSNDPLKPILKTTIDCLFTK